MGLEERIKELETELEQLKKNRSKLVLIESPYAGDIQRNITYARWCMRHALMHGEAPFLSHLLYTQALDDTIPEERRLGIEAGLLWGSAAGKSIIYEDLGISSGMQIGINNAKQGGRTVEYRILGKVPVPT